MYSAAPATSGSASKAALSNAAGGKAYLLKVAKVSSIRIFAPVLRRTKTVRRDYSIQDSLTNVGKVILQENMRSTEGVPGILLFNLASGSNPTRDDGLEMKYGWLKKYPTISQTVGGWSIQQEWEFGLWSTDLYYTV